MLFSPRKLIKWLYWLGRVSGIALPELELKPSFQWDWRLGGFAVAAIGIFFVRVAFSRILGLGPGHGMVTAPSPRESPHPNLPPFVFGLVAFLGGLYLLTKPRGFLRWMINRSSARTVLDKDLPLRGVLLIRVIGFLWMLAAVLAAMNRTGLIGH